MLQLVLNRLNASKCLNKIFNAFKGGVSQNIWLDRQRRDPYVKRAIKESYRARSAFKLIEIDAKYKFIKPGDVVIDVGAAPGSWSQVAVQKTNSNLSGRQSSQGLVISVDRDYIEPIDGAIILTHSDITDPKTIEKIKLILNDRKADIVLSDMAPNCTGQSTFDHDRLIELQRRAHEVSKLFLVNGGYFVCKLWFGDTVNEFKSELLKNFAYVKTVKPSASRDESAEIFLFCSNFKHS